MDERMVFAILGIEMTRDENAIRTAYRTLLTKTNPEDDPEGFKRLREAYEKAIAYAEAPEKEAEEEPEDSTPVGQWMSRVREIYSSLSRRLDEDEWKKLLREDVCVDLEYGEEIKWQLFNYLTNHFQLTSRIYAVLNEMYHIDEEAESFKEQLPIDFVDYMIRRATDTEGSMDFSFSEFEGADDADYDTFLHYYNDLVGQTQNEQTEAAGQTVRAMLDMHISHPLFLLEQSRTLLLEGEEEEALRVIRPILKERQDSLRIQVMGAEVLYQCGLKDEAVEIFRKYEENGYYIVEKYLTFYEKEQGNTGKAIKHCLRALRDGTDEKLEELLENMDTAFIDRCMPLAEAHTLDEGEASLLVGCFSRRNRPQEGLDFLKKYTEYTEKMPRLHEYLCTLYLQLKRYHEGIAESLLWREHVPEDYDEKKRQEYLGRSYLFEGEGWNRLGKEGEEGAFQKARACYEKAAQLNPDDLNLKQRILDIVIQMEQYEEAVKLADELIEVNPEWFPAYVQKQKACFELHRAQEVIDNFYIAKSIYAGYPEIYEKAAEVFCIFDKYSDADDIFAQAKEAGVASPGLDVLQLRCRRLKEWKEKRERNGGKESPEAKENSEELTKLAENLKNKYEQEPADDEVMEKLYRELGLLQRDRCDYRKAVEYFREALKYKDEPFCHYLLANALFDSNAGEEAIKEYKLYEEKAAPDEDLYINMARCYRFIGKKKEAVSYFQKVLEVNEENDEANTAISVIYREMLTDSGNCYYGNLALPYAHRQIEITPEDSLCLRERGLLYMEMNRYLEAKADFERSLEL